MPLNSITYAKATGIILMVLGHSYFPIPYVGQFIYMFHMPLFFFCSGYCFKDIYIYQPVHFVWKRIKGVWWPYVKYSILFLLLHNAFYRIGFYGSLSSNNWNHTFDNKEMLRHASDIITTMEGHELLVGGYWFMKALFFGTLIAFATILTACLLNKLISTVLKQFCTINNERTTLLLTTTGGVILVVVAMYLNKIEDTLSILKLTPQHLLAAILFLCGYLFSHFKIKKLGPAATIGALICVGVGAIFWYMGMGLLFYDNSKFIPYIITAVLGTWAVYSLPWHKMGRNISSLMQYVGTHTLAILTWHFLSMKLVSLIIVTLYHLPKDRLAEFPTISEYALHGWWVAYFIAGVVLPLLPYLVYTLLKKDIGQN